MRKIKIILIWAIIFSLSACCFSLRAEEKEPAPMSIVPTNRSLEGVKELGAHWIRLQIRWGTLEPALNQYNWKPVDKLIRQVKENNIGIALIIYTGQGWATYCDPKIATLNKKTHCPPKDLTNLWDEQYGYSKTYYNFLYNLAKRLKGYVNYFIIHNEVNTLRFWHATPGAYLRLRKTAYKAIHDANPEAIVIDNGLASGVWGIAIVNDLLRQGRDREAVDFGNSFFARQIDSPFKTAEEILSQAAEKRKKEKQRAIDFAEEIFKEPAFDWFSFHFYDNVEALPQVISWIKEQMKKNGYERPIIISECGYADSRGSLDDPLVQGKAARDLVKMHLIAFSQGVLQLHWLPIQEYFPQAGKFNASLKGLFSQNGEIRPAGRAWKFLNSILLKDFRVSKIDFPRVQLFAIESAAGKIFVAWSDEPVVLSASALGKDTFKVMNIFGEVIGDSATSIKLDKEPKYLK